MLFAILAALCFFVALFQRAPLGFDLLIAGLFCLALAVAFGDVAIGRITRRT